MRFLRCLFFMIPWLGGVWALDAVGNDLHLEDALHLEDVWYVAVE